MDAPNLVVRRAGWVCEVSSPSTQRIDRGVRTAICHRERVSYLWHVRPKERSRRAFRWTEPGYVLTDTLEGEVPARGALRGARVSAVSVAAARTTQRDVAGLRDTSMPVVGQSPSVSPRDHARPEPHVEDHPALRPHTLSAEAPPRSSPAGRSSTPAPRSLSPSDALVQ